MADKKKEVKVEKEQKEKVEEIGFDAGMESIGESLDVDTMLDRIYAAVDN